MGNASVNQTPEVILPDIYIFFIYIRESIIYTNFDEKSELKN